MSFAERVHDYIGEDAILVGGAVLIAFGAGIIMFACGAFLGGLYSLLQMLFT